MNFDVLNVDSGSVSPKTIGIVGDLYSWYLQCIVKDNYLYAIGSNKNSTQNMLYKCDLKTGNLVSQTNIPSNLINLAIAGIYDKNIVGIKEYDGVKSFKIIPIKSDGANQFELKMLEMSFVEIIFSFNNYKYHILIVPLT